MKGHMFENICINEKGPNVGVNTMSVLTKRLGCRRIKMMVILYKKDTTLLTNQCLEKGTNDG